MSHPFWLIALLISSRLLPRHMLTGLLVTLSLRTWWEHFQRYFISKSSTARWSPISSEKTLLWRCATKAVMSMHQCELPLCHGTRYILITSSGLINHLASGYLVSLQGRLPVANTNTLWKFVLQVNPKWCHLPKFIFRIRSPAYNRSRKNLSLPLWSSLYPTLKTSGLNLTCFSRTPCQSCAYSLTRRCIHFSWMPSVRTLSLPRLRRYYENFMTIHFILTASCRLGNVMKTSSHCLRAWTFYTGCCRETGSFRKFPLSKWGRFSRQCFMKVW
jgi:hypothetical protein